MHYQVKPYEEAKVVRCTKGTLYFVIVDIRPGAATFKKHYCVTLSSDNHLMLFIPEGFANGYLTLEKDTEVAYQMSEFYSPEHSRGFRWNDPAFCITWPSSIEVISDRDRNYSDFAVKS